MKPISHKCFRLSRFREPEPLITAVAASEYNGRPPFETLCGVDQQLPALKRQLFNKIVAELKTPLPDYFGWP